MRRLWVLVLLALALASTGAAPVAAVEEAKPGCDQPRLVSEIVDTRFPVREVSPARAFSPLPCDGVRPGGAILIPRGENTNLCTLNFLFIGEDAQKRKHVYMGTAGHCLLAETNLDRDKGEHRWAPGKGPAVTDVNGKRIGEFAYAVLQGVKDFALVRLDYGIKASSQMCWFGGPTGVNNDVTSATTRVHHYGHGLAIGDVLPARTSMAYGMRSADEVQALGVVIPGDSGGPAITADGRALGVIVTIGVSFRASPLEAGTVGITRITPQLNRAGRVLGQRMRMITAPLI